MSSNNTRSRRKRFRKYFPVEATQHTCIKGIFYQRRFCEIRRTHTYEQKDYSCALAGDILFHGRLFITPTALFFKSPLIRTAPCLLFKDIQWIKKRSTAGIIPNALYIHLSHKSYTLTSFVKRDAVYEMIVGLWEAEKSHERDMLREEVSSTHLGRLGKQITRSFQQLVHREEPSPLVTREVEPLSDTVWLILCGLTWVLILAQCQLLYSLVSLL